MFYKGETFAELFGNIRQDLLKAPVVETRGFVTKEILPVQLELTNPRSRLIYHKDRTYNLPFNIAELLTYLTGINSVGFLSFFNKKIKDYSDNGETFYGAYGPRLIPYYDEIVNKLKADRGSRQAVMTIYNSEDLMHKTKDVPCTIALDFKIRNDKLSLHTVMRSNDIVWGLQYDLFAFTLIQEILANTIDVEVGPYYHTATSLHVYDYHWDLLDAMTPETVEDIEMGATKSSLETYQKICRWVYKLVTGEEKDDRWAINSQLSAILYWEWARKNKVAVSMRLPEWSKKFLIK